MTPVLGAGVAVHQPRLLVGRDAERAIISAALDVARGGESCALALVGTAGIGKTSLLVAAEEQAEGFRIVRARGVEQEAEMPFSGLHELLAATMGEVRGSAPAHVKVLEGAFGTGRSVGADRFAIGVATLNILAALAEQRPILAVIDDVQWIDVASVEALLFASRRLRSEGVVLLIAGREPPAGTRRSGVLEHHLEGLDHDAARALLEIHTEGAVPSDVVSALVAATGGNPLALGEAARRLDPLQLIGAVALDDPPAVGLQPDLAFSSTVAALPAPTRRALGVMAALGRPGGGNVLKLALEGHGLRLADLEPAEAAGVLMPLGDRAEFVHPLFRSAAYHGLEPAARRAAHAAIARAGGLGRLGDAWAWHLAAATTGPDEDVGSALETVAKRQRARGGALAASRAFARAAGLTADRATQLRRLIAAAGAAQEGGNTAAAESLVFEGLAIAGDPTSRAELRWILARIAASQGRLSAARGVLVEEATRLEAWNRQRASLMLIDAAMPALWTFEMDPGVPDARRAYALCRALGSEAQAEAAIVLAMVLLGRLDEARPLLERWRQRVEEADAPLEGEHHALGLARVLLWTDRVTAARHVLGRLTQTARERSPSELPLILEVTADLEWRAGRWSHGHAAAAEGVELAEAMHQTLALARCLAVRARFDAATGRIEDCSEAVGRLGAVRSAISSEPWTRGLELPALGLSALAVGDVDRAVEVFSSVVELADGRQVRDPGAAPHRGDLIEALVKAGRVEETRRVLDALEQRATEAQRPGPRAIAARCRGLTGTGDDFEGHFERALIEHRLASDPFEEARTNLLLGERRRRARRRGDARAPLRSALATFEALGAVPWAERARFELNATGESVGQRRSAYEELTPQELRVALAVVDGATNREAAASLFLSVKTVEYHLTKVYEKLGVRSRTRLARLLTTQPGPPGSPADTEPIRDPPP